MTTPPLLSLFPLLLLAFPPVSTRHHLRHSAHHHPNRHRLSRTLNPVHWNSSNPSFAAASAAGSGDHNALTVDVRLGDKIDIFCPFYPKGRAHNATSHEVTRFHRVTRRQFRACSVDENVGDLSDDSASTTRWIFDCDAPRRLNKYTIHFRRFSPLPNGLQFESGRVYYFVSTSTGSKDGIANTRGGLCGDKNLRIAFRVEGSRLTSAPSTPGTPAESKNAGNAILNLDVGAASPRDVLNSEKRRDFEDDAVNAAQHSILDALGFSRGVNRKRNTGATENPASQVGAVVEGEWRHPERKPSVKVLAGWRRASSSGACERRAASWLGVIGVVFAALTMRRR